MNKKFGMATLLGILALSLVLNLTVTSDVQAQSGLPCYDQWAGCKAGGGSDAFCDGMWCACMYREYGYICNAEQQAQ